MKVREELPALLSSMGLTDRGVEVGTYEAYFARIILDGWGGTLYMVDPWRQMGDDYRDTSNQQDKSVINKALDTLSGVEDRAIMVRCTSLQAVSLFPDESLDFVYIDANHEYSYVLEDMHLWYPKVKKGGLFCGHDYMPSLTYADDEYNKNTFYPNGEFSGVFGVNAAIRDFAKGRDIEYQYTDEHWATWYTVKK